MLSSKVSLYVLDTVFYEICDLQMFSVILLFGFSFFKCLEEQKLLILVKSNLLMFSFVIYVSCVSFKKSFPNTDFFFPVLSSKSFIALTLNFRSMGNLFSGNFYI